MLFKKSMHVYVCMYCYFKITFPAYICQMFSVFHPSKLDGGFKFDVWSSKDFEMTKMCSTQTICTQIGWGVSELKHKSSCLPLVLNFITCKEKILRKLFSSDKSILHFCCYYEDSTSFHLFNHNKASSPAALWVSMTQ